jgi:hypothetical protein
MWGLAPRRSVSFIWILGQLHLRRHGLDAKCLSMNSRCSVQIPLVGFSLLSGRTGASMTTCYNLEAPLVSDCEDA